MAVVVEGLDCASPMFVMTTTEERNPLMDLISEKTLVQGAKLPVSWRGFSHLHFNSFSCIYKLFLVNLSCWLVSYWLDCFLSNIVARTKLLSC
ncbi:unnamed protein product [Trifolium pratense]|uniref:Uncharacterized protein n=1 Tax=Trifolium pratense TaxID=57577 RepID=A0ACB0JES8_TRIPR|nr:unnamed protein product [Trifolium pratense]